MKAICIDDEELIMNLTVSMCKEIKHIDSVNGFTEVKEALEWLETHPVDIAILDIDMPEMNGISLALLLKMKNPDVSIIFVTGFSEYAVDAFKMHASGYLMKPISKDRLEKEIEFVAETRKVERPYGSHIVAKTFGEFDIFVDGKLVTFKRAKSKELLAYLIDRQGGSVTRSAVFT